MIGVKDLSLYLVTDRRAIGERNFFCCIEQALKGGVTILQLREKNLSSKDFFTTALNIRRLCHQYNVPLIINDRVDIALAVEADGVHLGPDDLPVSKAREILGKDKIIGASARTIEMAIEAEKQGADYLGCGAMYTTSTKDNTTPMSIDQLHCIRRSIHIPIVAIGGINRHNIKPLLQLGVNGYAISSGILENDDINSGTKELLKIINSNT